MHVDVLVLRNAHLVRPHTDVELTIFQLNLIWMLANSCTSGIIAVKLDYSISTIDHYISELYKITGANGHGGLVGFGIINQFLRRGDNGEILKAWESNDVVVWEWRKRKRGEKK